MWCAKPEIIFNFEHQQRLNNFLVAPAQTNRLLVWCAKPEKIFNLEHQQRLNNFLVASLLLKCFTFRA